VYSDEVIFTAIYHVIVTDGYERLTLARLAELLGCTSPALIKRFTSRQGLLLAYLRWCTTRTKEHLATVVADRSPLDRLLAYLDPRDADGGIAPCAVTLPHLAGLVLDAGTDPLSQTALREHSAVVVTATQLLLDTTVAAGELSAVDTRQLSRRLLEAVTGAALLTELETRGSGESPARGPGDVVLDLLAPYRIGLV
jgi:AcrR family transcriptional regulator